MISAVTIAGAVVGIWAMLSIVGAERDRELKAWRQRQAAEAAAMPPPEPAPAAPVVPAAKAAATKAAAPTKKK